MPGDTDVVDSLQIKMSANVGSATQSIGNLIKRLEKLETTCANMSAAGSLWQTFSTLNVATSLLTTNTARFNQQIIDLGRSLGQLDVKSITNGAAAMNRYLPRINRAAVSAGKGFNVFSGSMTGAIVKARAFIAVARRLWRSLSGSVNLASDLVEVQNVVDKAFGNQVSKVNELVQTSIQDLGMSELTAKQISSRYQAMGSALGISGRAIEKASAQVGKLRDGYTSTASSMADMSLNLTRLAADMASFYNVEIEDAAQALNSVFTGQTRPLRQFGLDLTQATLAEWAMKQGIDADVKSMSQAEKTLLRYQYVMSQTKMIQGDFADTADTWANRIKVLRQQLQAIGAVLGGGIINAVKPVVAWLNNVLNSVLNFSRSVINALGKIFGWEIEVTSGGSTLSDEMIDLLEEQADALDSVADAADNSAAATNKATKANKDYQRTVLGFDELNKLNAESAAADSGSPLSGNGGAGNGAGSSAVLPGAVSAQDVAVSFKRTKALYESEIDNLFDLGRYISDSLRNALDSINWEEIYARSERFGKGFAQFLNGLITPDTFASLGSTIAKSINSAFIKLDSFVDEFDFENFGQSLAAFLNAAIEDFDVKLVANSLWKLVQGLFTAAVELVDDLDWDLLYDKINTAFDDIPFLGDLWHGIVDFFTNVYDIADTVVSAVGPILSGLVNALAGADGENMKSIGEGLGYILGAVAAFKIGSGVIGNLSKLAGPISSLFTALGPWGTIAAAATVFGTWIYGVIDAANNWRSEDTQKIFDLSSAVSGITSELSGDLGGIETNYTYISGVLDKYVELNNKLVSGESLTATEETMLKEYYRILEENVPGIVDKIGEIGSAYINSTDDLQGLINKEFEHARSQYYLDRIEELGRLYSEQEATVNKLNSEIDQRMLEAMRSGLEELRYNDYYGGLADASDEELLGWIEDIKNGTVPKIGDNEREYTAVMAAASGGVSAIKTWEDYQKALAKADETTQQITADINLCYDGLNNLSTQTGKTSTVFVNGVAGMSNSVKPAFDKIVSGAKNAWEALKTHTNKITEKLKEGASGMKTAFFNSWEKIKESLNPIADLFTYSVERSLGVLRDAGPQIQTETTNLVAGAGEAGEKQSKITIASLVASISNALGIKNGSSTVVAEQGKSIPAGMEAGEKAGAPSLVNTTSWLLTQMQVALSNARAAMTPSGTAAVDGIKGGAEARFPVLNNYMIAIKNAMAGAFNGANTTMYGIGHDAIANLNNGMRSVKVVIPHLQTAGSVLQAIGGVNMSVPNYTVGWYASGGLVTSPSIIGVGEAGREAVLPLQDRGAMKEIASAIVYGMVDSGALANAVTRGMVAAGNNNQPVIVNATLRTENDEVLARAVSRGQQKLNYRLSPVGV